MKLRGAPLSLSLLLALSPEARSGPPLPCGGPEYSVCDAGWIHRVCCDARHEPDHAVCKAGAAGELDSGWAPSRKVAARWVWSHCGAETCVKGTDVSRCPSPIPLASPLPAGGACPGYNTPERACVDRRVTQVCVQPLPSNFSGPPPIPAFTECGGGRCTTHLLPEDCHVSAPALPRPSDGSPCATPEGPGRWTRVCLDAKLDLKCVPLGRILPPGQTGAAVSAQRWFDCPDGSCAVGADATACNR